MAFAKEAVYRVYCKNRLSSRSNFIVFRIFKIGFQLGSTFDPALSDGTVRRAAQGSVHERAAIKIYYIESADTKILVPSFY